MKLGIGAGAGAFYNEKKLGAGAASFS